jgi:hypothetical protein
VVSEGAETHDGVMVIGQETPETEPRHHFDLSNNTHDVIEDSTGSILLFCYEIVGDGARCRINIFLLLRVYEGL